MKCLLIVMLCALVGGCIGSTLKDFWAENPGSPVYIVDDDGDGVPEALASKDGELAGTREQFTEAGIFDEHIGALLGLFGGGAATGLYRLLKPAKRTLHAEAMFRGVVGAVQKVREEGSISTETMAVINNILKEVTAGIPGIKEAIAKAKETNM